MDHDELQKAFLIELDALEAFRIAYTAQFPGASLAHDDPDVRRLLDAMAFFSARTRLAAQRGIDDSVRRIFRQHFPFLLGPTPAMAMLKGTVSQKFADASELPAGSLVALHERADDRGAPGARFLFRTLAPLRLLPLRIRGVDTITRPDGGYRLLIGLEANAPSNQSIGELSLHINHLDDLVSSATVFQELRNRMTGACVLYGGDIIPQAQGQSLSVAFGSTRGADVPPDPYLHPIQLARMQVCFPQADLMMTFAGFQPPRNWRQLTLCVDLDKDWPRTLRLTPDGFELHTVSMMNVSREFASPLEVDGTRDRYLLQHPEAGSGYVPLWPFAAQRPTKAGFVPLVPAVFGVEADSFEAWAEGRGGKRRGYASFRLRGAYLSPERISVDTFWHQPAVGECSLEGARLGLHERYVADVAWSLSGAIAPSLDSWVDADREAQLQLVSMKAMPVLGLDELRLLLRACGVDGAPYFYKEALDMLDEVEVRTVPSGRRAGVRKLVYYLTFRKAEFSVLPRIALFRDWIERLLATWSSGDPPEVVADVPELRRQFCASRSARTTS